MNATQATARRLAVPALVTAAAAAAAWFVLASGVALAADAQRGVVTAAPTPITLTPEGTMKLTVVAARPDTQIMMTPEGSMKLTVVAQRTQTARVHTAAVRKASQG